MDKREGNVTEQTYIPYWHFYEMHIQMYLYLYLYLYTETNTGKNTDSNADKNTDTKRKGTNLHSFVTFF